ncbi:DUF4189 domain-containing protein [Ensifer soli]|uniref:DUF4189 domain-containing protein n=1 Tax=Ciceribacter sp. sgz301302 TaxID=3342379 RepID=UPI0035B98A5C
MAAQVHIDPETGMALISLVGPLPVGQRMKFSLFDAKARKYLTSNGWASSRKTFAEVVPETDTAEIMIEPETAQLIAPGTVFVIEEIFIGLRETVTWPKPAKSVPPPVAASIAVVTAPTPEISPPPQEDVATPPSEQSRTGRPLWVAVVAGLVIGAGLSYGGLAFTGSNAPPQEEAAAIVVEPKTVKNTAPAEDTFAVKELKKMVSSLEFKLSQANASDASARKWIDDQKKVIATLQDQIQALRSKAPAPATVASADGNSGLKQQAAELRREVVELKMKLLEKSRSDNDGSAAAIEASQKQLETLNVDRAQLNARIDEQVRIIASLRTETTRLKSQLVSPSDVASSGDPPTTAGHQSTITALEQDLATYKAKVEQQEARIAEFERLQLEQQQSEPETEEIIVPVDYWLGAAVSSSGSVEVSTGQSSGADAQDAVMDKCQAGGLRCEFIGFYQNMCFAVARPQGQRIRAANYWYRPGKTAAEARQGALYECNQLSGGQCSIAFTRCASE